LSHNRLPAGWVIATAVAVAAHSAVAIVLLRPAMPHNEPAPMLMIEMVPAPPGAPPPGIRVPDSSQLAVEPSPRLDPDLREPSPSPPKLEPSEPAPFEPPPLEPPPAETTTLPDLPVLDPLRPEQFAEVAVPLPPTPSEKEPEEPILRNSARPQRKPDTPVQRRDEPRQAQRTPVRERPRQEAPRQPQAATLQSGAAGQEPTRSQSGAPASGAGQATSPQAVQSWQAQVRQAVARHMSRTRVSAREALTATLAVRVDRAGRVVGVSLAGGSGNARVDAALSAQARRLPRLPAPPDGRPRDLVVPFRINR